MSGGAFDYEDARLLQLIDTLENWVSVEEEQPLDPRAEKYIRQALKNLVEIHRRLHHIDWALSGDTDMDEAMARILTGAEA